MLHLISAWCVAHDLHAIAPWSLKCTCWRQFTAEWGDCKKSQIAPFNATIIIIIKYNNTNTTNANITDEDDDNNDDNDADDYTINNMSYKEKKEKKKKKKKTIPA